MIKAVAINGSPNMEKGDTSMVLAPFIEGMKDAKADVELFYTRRLEIKPCTCGEMYCWYNKPGECCIKDDMQTTYPNLREANILIFATPVYIPLPGEMQNFVNRLCPLVKPLLETRNGRTRGRFREKVKIQKIVLISTGGWWEKENFDVVIHIVEELALNASVEFAGAVIRPHAFLMKKKGEITKDGENVLGALQKAGNELIKEEKISKETLKKIRHPLISQEELRRKYNNLLRLKGTG